ncbi:3055_t:CDS:2 [Cetraspora pellucida]|uniref:3055_t:CDS:1 n=1 Tax=Cetraspora pellucida TaxID=1433469 RepID=A0ACA9MZG8_9GLOM|nr:3055_t:CDS:2 [Cetraspora pellucida]
MKGASNKMNPIGISGLPCNLLCDPEDDGIDVVKYNVKNLNGDSIKYGKSNYNKMNVIINTLIMLNRFGQTISKDVPKASRLRLDSYFCQIDMGTVLNTESGKGIDLFNDIKLYELSNNFIVILSLLVAKNKNIFIKEKIDLKNIFKKGTYRFDNTDNNMKYRLNQDEWEIITVIDILINIRNLLKNNQAKCCNKPFWHNFSIFVYYSHVQSLKNQKPKLQGMPYDSKMTRKRIENSMKLDLEYNTDITHSSIEPKFPTYTGPFLVVDKVIPMMTYNTNMDSMSSLKYTTGSAMQQLVNAIKAVINNPTEKPITAEENKTIEDMNSKKLSKEKLSKKDLIASAA